MRRPRTLVVVASLALLLVGAAGVAVRALQRETDPAPIYPRHDSALDLLNFDGLPVGPVPDGWSVTCSPGVSGAIRVTPTPDTGTNPEQRRHQLLLDYTFGNPAPSTEARSRWVLVTIPPSALPDDTRQLWLTYSGTSSSSKLWAVLRDQQNRTYRSLVGDLDVLTPGMSVGGIAVVSAEALQPAGGSLQGSLTPVQPGPVESAAGPEQSGLQPLPAARPADPAADETSPTVEASEGPAPAPGKSPPATAPVSAGTTAPPLAASPQSGLSADTGSVEAPAMPASSTATAPEPARGGADAPPTSEPSPPASQAPAVAGGLSFVGFIVEGQPGITGSEQLRVHSVRVATSSALSLDLVNLGLVTPDGTGVITSDERGTVGVRVGSAADAALSGQLRCEVVSFSGRRWTRSQAVSAPAGSTLDLPVPVRPPGEGFYTYRLALEVRGARPLTTTETLAVVPSPSSVGRQRFGLGYFEPSWLNEFEPADAVAGVARLGAGWLVLSPNADTYGTTTDRGVGRDVREEYYAAMHAHKLGGLLFLASSTRLTEAERRELRDHRQEIVGWRYGWPAGGGQAVPMIRDADRLLGRRAWVAPMLLSNRTLDGQQRAEMAGARGEVAGYALEIAAPIFSAPDPTPKQYTEAQSYRGGGWPQEPTWCLSLDDPGGRHPLTTTDRHVLHRRQARRLAILVTRWAATIAPDDRCHYRTLFGDDSSYPAGLYAAVGQPKPSAAAFATAVNLLAEARPTVGQELAGDGYVQQFTTPHGSLTACWQKDKYDPREKPRQHVKLMVTAPEGAVQVNVVGERRELRPGTRLPLTLCEDLTYFLGPVTISAIPAQEHPSAHPPPRHAADEVH